MGLENASIQWIALLMWEHVFSSHRIPCTCQKTSCLLLFFLGRGLHNATFSEQTDCGLISCDWVTSLLPGSGNWGQILACFLEIFVPCPIKLAQENFWNLLKMYSLSWPSLTTILKVTFNAFLNVIFSVSNPSSLRKY